MIIERVDERFRGKLSKKEMQKIEFNILKHVIKFCDENDISYFLYGGTLLGAIRDKGFIAWDDDVDIAMLRDDYDKFIRLYKNDGRYILTSHEIDKDYYLPIAKVYDNHTYLDERTTQRISMGVYLDIFPIDAYDNYEFRYFLNKLKVGLIFCRIGLIKKDNTFLNNLLIVLGRVIGFWVPINKTLRSLEKNIRKTPVNEAKKVCHVTFSGFKRLPYKYEYISEMIDWPFEDIIAKVPKGYDNLLKHFYGDYMTPPPPKKQKTLHEKFFCGYKEEYKQQHNDYTKKV